MLPEEQAANSRYFYELASARFGFRWDKLQKRQAFHFKGGQGRQDRHRRAPARRQGERQDRRGARASEGQPRSLLRVSRLDRSRASGLSPTRCASRPAASRSGSSCPPSTSKTDIDAALEVGVDYIILDGRGGGTGAAPLIFRDNISVPTIPRWRGPAAPGPQGRRDVTLIITGGLRTPADFAQGAGARRRRCRGFQLRHAGDRLPGHAGLPHQQLPRRHRHAETASARAPAVDDVRDRLDFLLGLVELMQVLARAWATITFPSSGMMI